MTRVGSNHGGWDANRTLGIAAFTQPSCPFRPLTVRYWPVATFVKNGVSDVYLPFCRTYRRGMAVATTAVLAPLLLLVPALRSREAEDASPRLAPFLFPQEQERELGMQLTSRLGAALAFVFWKRAERRSASLGVVDGLRRDDRRRRARSARGSVRSTRTNELSPGTVAKAELLTRLGMRIADCLQLPHSISGASSGWC